MRARGFNYVIMHIAYAHGRGVVHAHAYSGAMHQSGLHAADSFLKEHG